MRLISHSCSRHLYNLLIYYKMYPNHRLLFLIFDTKAVMRKNIVARMRRTEEYLAHAMTEVKSAYSERHGDHNILPHMFDRNVTASVDTFPVYCSRPKDAWWQRKMYNGKYGMIAFRIYLCAA